MACITFGAPRTGNHAWARMFNEAVPNCWHVINGALGGEKERGMGRESGSDAWKYGCMQTPNKANFCFPLCRRRRGHAGRQVPGPVQAGRAPRAHQPAWRPGGELGRLPLPHAAVQLVNHAPELALILPPHTCPLTPSFPAPWGLCIVAGAAELRRNDSPEDPRGFLAVGPPPHVLQDVLCGGARLPVFCQVV